MFYIAQIFGFLGILVLSYSYQQKTKEKFLGLQILSNSFYFLQYLFLNAKSASVICIFGIIKTVIFYKYEKENKRTSLLTLLIFQIIVIVIGIITYSSIMSLIPIFVTFIYNYGSWQRNLKITYSIGMLVGLLWMVYNISVGAYVGTIGGLFEFLASSIGLFRLNKKVLK